jgi:hypothetical protein
MNKDKNLLISFLTVVVVGIIIWLNLPEKTEEVAEEQTAEQKEEVIESLEEREDTTTAINEDLEGINLPGLEEEFRDIDNSLQEL